MFSKLKLLLTILVCVESVPFVTKRVSLHNPIAIDFSGWKPLRHSNSDPMMTSETQQQEEHSLDKQFLTVPVAVETDQEHILSDEDLNKIREHVIHNWHQKPVKSESMAHMRPLVTSLLPKAELEVEKQEKEDQLDQSESQILDSEYTFVRMERPLNETQENFFHAYFAPKEHIPPEGYIRLTKSEFKNVFKNAEILFV